MCFRNFNRKSENGHFIDHLRIITAYHWVDSNEIIDACTRSSFSSYHLPFVNIFVEQTIPK